MAQDAITFSLQLQLQGIQISTTPMRQVLSRVGVETLSNRKFDTVPQLIAREDLMSILEREVDWLFVESEGLSDRLISASLPKTISALINQRSSIFLVHWRHC